MIIQYRDFFRSWENFIQIRPDMMIEMIYHDHSFIKKTDEISNKINDNFFILRYCNKSFIDTVKFLDFTSNFDNINVYHVYNSKTCDYKLFASKIELDINSNHYTNNENIVTKITNRQLTNFLNQR